MPLFYFDSDDGDQKLIDDIGMEFANIQEAREEAIRSLPDMARDVLPDGDRRSMWVSVRDEHGSQHFRATLSLLGEWLIQPAV